MLREPVIKITADAEDALSALERLINAIRDINAIGTINLRVEFIGASRQEAQE